MAERMNEIKEKLTRTDNGVLHEMTDQQGNSAAIQFTADQLETMLLRIGKEMRKPDDVTLAKQAQEEQRRQESMRQMIALANIEIDSKKNMQARCSHKKEDGRTLWHGQIHSDGKYHPLCLRCQMLGTPLDPPRELLAQGIS